MKILLMIDNTVLKEYIFDQNEITVGRDADRDICLDDIAVSREHALITKGPDDYFVEDMGSINGTFINGHWVSKKLLDAGDEISIGKYILKIYFEAGPVTTKAKKNQVDEVYDTYRMGLNDYEKILKRNSKK